MYDKQSLSHTIWECKRHLVWANLGTDLSLRGFAHCDAALSRWVVDHGGKLFESLELSLNR